MVIIVGFNSYAQNRICNFVCKRVDFKVADSFEQFSFKARLSESNSKWNSFHLCDSFGNLAKSIKIFNVMLCRAEQSGGQNRAHCSAL